MIDESAASTESSVRRFRDWRGVLANRLVLTDLLVLIWVVFGVQIGWLGFDSSARDFAGGTAYITINYTVISVSIVLAWMLMLQVFGTRGYRVVGAGSDEYKLIATGALRLFGVLAIIAFLFKIDLARGYILIAFPLGVIVLMFSRWMWRQWLVVKRLQGEFSSKVLLVGSHESVTAIAAELMRDPGGGYQVVGACVPSGKAADYLADTEVPVMGSVEHALDALAASKADTVVLTSADDLSPRRMKQLSWGLEPGHQHLVVAPGLVGIGGPRIHTRPVAGLPLIHVETPRYGGGQHFTKRAFDVVVSAALIMILSPLLGLLALLVKLSSPGSALFKQTRVGLGGEHFSMYKFRSMVMGAEALRTELEERERGAGNEVLFKMKNDPRITGVGRFLRRFSLDELPQLFNVFSGSMSLVGPRPPLEREVLEYEAHVHRRFLVKPGVTGLWQVSGRSNLSWEDSVRLDLYYVENWSITGDLVILWRTLKAVLAREGAY